VRALRAENSRLEARLERLEREGRQDSPRAAPAPAAIASGAERAPEALPALTVVKLRPRPQAAPRVETQVAVVEPPEGLADELKPSGRSPDDADLQLAQAAYDKGLEALKTGNLEGGMAQLQQFVSDWPRHPRADNALYFVGVALMGQQDFTRASQLFERVLAVYPAGDAVVDAMLKLGECRVHLKQPQLARAAWEGVVAAFPGTAAATQASARLQAFESTVSRNSP
jgi:tol-pal system protein YbgF